MANPPATGPVLTLLVPGDAPLPAPLVQMAEQMGQRLHVLRDADLAFQGGTEPVVVVLQGARAALAAAMAQGRDPLAERQAWATGTALLLAVLRRVRARVLLLEAGALQADPAGGLAALAARLPAAAGIKLDSPEPATPRPALDLLAEALIGADPATRDLEDEIEAMALHATPPLSETPGLVTKGVTALIAQRARADRADQLQAELTQATAALATVQSTMAALQADLDVARAERDALASDLAGRPAADSPSQADEIRLLTEDITQLQSALDHATLEVRLTQASLDAVPLREAALARDAQSREAVLGAVMLQDSAEALALRQALASALAERDAARTEVSALRTSTSWKMTGPVRAVARGLGRD